MNERISEIVESLRNKHNNLCINHQIIIKNGVEKNAIVIREKAVSIAPSIYVDEMLGSYSNDDICDLVYHQYESHKAVLFDVATLTNKNWILDHLNIGCQKSSTQELIKRDFPEYPDIEFYLYVADTSQDNENFSIKISPTHLEMCNIEINDAWNVAMEHLSSSTTIQSMTSVLTAMMPDCDFLDLDTPFDVPMYIISNTQKTLGAGCLLNKQALNDFCEKLECDKLVILPSSIHEAILLPADSNTDLEQLTEMVQEVNSTQVLPEEQLSNRIFIYEKE